MASSMPYCDETAKGNCQKKMLFIAIVQNEGDDSSYETPKNKLITNFVFKTHKSSMFKMDYIQ